MKLEASYRDLMTYVSFSVLQQSPQMIKILSCHMQLVFSSQINIQALQVLQLLKPSWLTANHVHLYVCTIHFNQLWKFVSFENEAAVDSEFTPGWHVQNKAHIYLLAFQVSLVSIAALFCSHKNHFFVCILKYK